MNELVSSPIAEKFERLVFADATRVAVETLRKSWSREDLWTISDSIKDLLQNGGLVRGDVVAVRMRNSVELIGAILASLRFGLVLVPLDRDARETEVEKISISMGARALLTEGDPVSIRSTILATDPPSLPAGTALIKLTSGSTGAPRGVATSEQNLIADAESICATMGITASDRNFGAIPLSHSYGFSNLVTPLLTQGTAVVVSNDYLPLSIIRLSNETSCTILPGVPMIFDHLSSLPPEDGTFETLRTCISAGAPLRPQTAAKFQQRFDLPIHTFYGCSESGGISYDRDGGAAARGTVGAPMTGVEVQTSEATLTVSSLSVALGYVNATPEENARLGGGVYSAEDVAEMTAEGELRITGRVGDLINVAGRKVNPREVEAVILSMPGVRDVRVSGVDGGTRGDFVAAVVEATELDQAEVRRFCAARLASHKLPRRVRIVEQLPRDERGKIKRSELDEM